MKKLPKSATKIRIITLGCSKNTVDSETLAGMLNQQGFILCNDGEDADAVVINTCGFINDAKAESVDAILEQIENKNKGKLDRVIVMGCLSGRYLGELQKEIPEADGFFGSCSYAEVITALGGHSAIPDYSARILSTPSHYAYLKISEGCDRACSFCAIPLIRGKHVSREVESLLDEAGMLIDKGVKEIIVVAQDTTYYGLDKYGERKIAALMHKLASLDPGVWIRLHYAYPAGFPEDLADVFALHPNICRYLDIPLQHISDRILKSMKRAVTAADTRALLQNIRRKIPGVAIRTTLITGYPGETEAEFEDLTDFIREQRFERLGVFAYSAEAGTPAYKLNDDVPEKLKQERAEAIIEIQRSISLENNLACVGKKMKVLVDEKEGGYFLARTESDSPEVDNLVMIPAGEPGIKPGTFQEVKIRAAGDYELFV